MKKQHQKLLLAMTVIAAVSTGCNIARISKGTTVYQWNNSRGNAPTDSLHIFKVQDPVDVTITDKDDYLTVKAKDAKIKKFEPLYQRTILKNLPADWHTELNGKYFYPETKFDSLSKDYHFHYTEWKHGLQGLTVLLKFRGNIPEDKVPRIPPMVESGSTFAMAYGFRHSWNSYNPDKNIWGKRITTFSITFGPMLGGSTAELKAATNAPELGGDRKSAVISYGGFVTVGTGPINIGYAVGADRVLGYGASNWVYGGKVWHGLIFGINLITF